LDSDASGQSQDGPAHEEKVEESPDTGDVSQADWQRRPKARLPTSGYLIMRWPVSPAVGGDECREMEKSIVRARSDTHCVQRAVAVTALFPGLGIAGVAYGLFLRADFPYNTSEPVLRAEPEQRRNSTQSEQFRKTRAHLKRKHVGGG